jgi:hypothetical protein
MEIIVLICTLIGTATALWSAFNKSERHLREIRDVLIDIRDDLRGPSA